MTQDKMDEIRIRLSALLQTYKEANRTNYTAMARQLHMARRSVGRFVFDPRTPLPNASTLIKLADLLEVSIDYILCRTDEK